MGLDMYLKRYRKVKDIPTEYIFEVANHVWAKDEEEAKKWTPEVLHALVAKNQYGSWVLGDEVAYWRKANMIHGWFVDNVQGGNDNCDKYEVELEQLKTLRDLCKEVLDDHDAAPDVLPTASGFFFGGTEYDDYYYQDLEETVTNLDRIIKEDDGQYIYAYQSSW